jgi:DtxR family Mn-dependent transcriptional regulator
VTHSEENYLKAIFHLGGLDGAAISTNAIAEQMETKPSSVTDMVKKLSEKGLVNYKKYQGVSLTSTGRTTALAVIRKHRLWEVFLVEKLDFSWDEVHEVAEQLEHIKSEKLIDQLDQMLEFPKYDPHGDPIPGKNGEFQERDKQLLSKMPLKSKGVCVGVKDSSATFLKFLDKNDIALGNLIEVLDKEDFDNSLYIRVGDRKIQVSHQIASNLYVKPNDT